MDLKQCKACLTFQPVENFYINRGTYRKSKCKLCYNSNRYSYQKGFNGLSTAVLTDIKRRLANGEKKMAIARFHNIVPQSFYVWFRKGKFD